MNNPYYIIDGEAMLVPLSRPQGSSVYNTYETGTIYNGRYVV